MKFALLGLMALPTFATADVPAVRTVIVAPAPDSLSRQFFGQVRARETVDLSFDVGGRILQLVPEEGQRVQKGDVLAQLDLDPLQRAAERARLSLEMSEREAARAVTLADRQIGARAGAEDAATARDMAEIALRDAEAALDDATLRAPFDGLVVARITPTFSAVSAGQPVLRLHDLSQLRIDFALPEQMVQQVGSLDDVAFSALLSDGQEATLDLVAFQPDTSDIGQSYTITLAFADDAVDLLPGASVTIRARVPSMDQTRQVPATALLAGSGRDASVLTLQPDGDAFVLRAQPVTVVASTGAQFAVEGLADGAEIVVAGAHLLQDGQQVRRYTGLTTSED